jgi:branched-chain amino acid aminotransferase
MDQQYIVYNSEVICQNLVGPNLSNRAFKYGDGFFESLRTSFRIPLLFDFHFERIQKGLNIFGITEPANLKQVLFESILRLQQKNNQLHARIRINLFRETGGLYLPMTNNLSFSIESSPIEKYSYVLNTKGVLLTFSPVRKIIGNPTDSIKSLNCFPFVQSAIWAKANNFEDAILLNQTDEVCETISSNIFVVKDECICTPHLLSGCVDGIMRRKVISIIKSLDIPFNECVLTKTVTCDADEIILTNSTMGVQYVKALNSKRYTANLALKLTLLLNSEISS